MTIGTLIRVTRALDSRVEIKLVRRKGTKPGRQRNGGEKSKPAAFEGCDTRGLCAEILPGARALIFVQMMADRCVAPEGGRRWNRGGGMSEVRGQNECPHAWRIGLPACGRVADGCFAWTASKVYCFFVGSFAAVGSIVAALGLVVAAAIMALGRQKSAATFAISSGGLLISGAKR